MSSCPVLIIIDVQKGFHNPKWGKRNNPDAEEQIEKLLKHWREKSLPVIHIRHASVYENSPLHPNQPGFEIMDRVKPHDEEPLITKSVNSAFIGTDLETRLRDKGYDTLVITGLTTNHCVSTTTRMAGNLGFATYLIEDATATFDRTDHKGNYYSAEDIHYISLAGIHEEFATILTARQAIDQLT